MPRPTPDLKVLGSVLRGFRQKKGWTQEKLYLKTGLATPLVSGGENGARNLSFDTLERWLRGLGVSWAEFGRAIDETSVS